MNKIFKKYWNSPTVTTWASFLTKSFNVTVIMPLVLSRLSTGDVNLWYLYASMISLQVLLDAGFGSAFVRVIAYGTVGVDNFINIRKKDITNDKSKGFDKYFISNIYHLMIYIYIRLSIFSFIILLTVGTWVFKDPISASSQINSSWITWIVFIISFPLIIGGNVYLNMLQGTNNIALVRRWDTVFNLLSSISCIIILIVLPNISLLVLASLFWLLIAVYRNYRLVIKKYPFIRQLMPDKGKIVSIRKDIIPNALKSGLGLLMSQGIIQSSGFIYAQLVSPNTLAPYLVGLNLIQAIRNFAQAPFYSRLPELAAYTGKGDIDGLKNVARRNMFKVYLIYSIGFFCVSFFHQPIFNLIHSNVNFPDNHLWNLLGLAFLIDRYGAMHLQLYSTTNHIIWHTVNGITGILMIGASVILYPTMGVYSLPTGMLIGYALFYSWYAPYRSYRLIHESFWSFEKMSFMPFLVCMVLYTFLTAI